MKTLLVMLAAAMMISVQPEARPEVIPLWPEGVPGAIPNGGAEVMEEPGRLSNVHVPTLTAYPAPQPARNGTAVVICPGGAYRRLAIDKEGSDIAAWLNKVGVTAFVLKYRLRQYGHPAPLRDVLRAIRLVRHDAARWGIDPSRIGVMGFSAGGHLAASAATLFDDPAGRTGAALDLTSARPDFQVLLYPVISMSSPYVHAGSREALVGSAPTPELVDHLSLQLQVTRSTPPAFLVHGSDDTSVPAENSGLYYLALKKAGVPAELHAYDHGPHGMATLPGNGPMSDWPRRCEEWMKARKLLSGS